MSLCEKLQPIKMYFVRRAMPASVCWLLVLFGGGKVTFIMRNSSQFIWPYS